MTRVFMTLDETNPLRPVPCLHANGNELMMSEAELEGLIAELKWIKDCMKNCRAIHYSNLAKKYTVSQARADRDGDLFYKRYETKSYGPPFKGDK